MSTFPFEFPIVCYCIISFSSVDSKQMSLVKWSHHLSASVIKCQYFVSPSSLLLLPIALFPITSLCESMSSHGMRNQKVHIKRSPSPPKVLIIMLTWIETCKLASSQRKLNEAQKSVFGQSQLSDEEGPHFVPDAFRSSQSVAYFYISTIIKSTKHWLVLELFFPPQPTC